MLPPKSHLKRLLIQHGFGKQLLESGVLAAKFTGGDSGLSLAENTDDLLVGKTLLQGDALIWLMKTLLTSGCTH